MKYMSAFGIIAGFCFSTFALATDYYVNPKGNDLWSGTLKQPNIKRTDGPFKTLERAKQAIRTLKQTNTFNDKVTVNIASGTYYLSQPLSFNSIDSGFPDREILWQGESGAQVNISAGMPLTCKRRYPKFWDCPLTQMPVNSDYFDDNRIKGNAPKFELFVNDQKLELARWPDKGWAHIKAPLDRSTQFSVMEWLPTLTGDIKAVQVHIFAGNDWYDQYIGIESVNLSVNAITLSASTGYELASGRRFYIQNAPSLLNAPGEWIYDASAKKITFISPSGITPKAAMLSSLPNILVAEDVGYITFKNLNFQYSAGGAVTILNSNNIILEKLNINNVGGRAMAVQDSENILLSNSTIHHAGGGGVLMTGGNSSTLEPSGNIAHNNYIHHYDTVLMNYSAAIDMKGVGVTATHNLIEQGNGLAILLEGNEHLVEKNDLHHICLQASDCGAIYSGRDWSWRGNVIRNNYVHEIIGYGMKSVDVTTNQVVYQSPDGARGVYLDDGASGFDVSGNIFENAGLMSIQIGGGRDNKIFNNYFRTNEYAIFIDDRWPTYDWNQNQINLDASPYKTAIWQQKYPELTVPMHNKTWPEGNRIERNVLVSTKTDGISLVYMIPRDSTVIADNLIWSTTGEPVINYKILEDNMTFWGASWEQWIAERIEQGNIAADPCVTISNNKMTTCQDSPVNDIGFDSLPADIGLI